MTIVFQSQERQNEIKDCQTAREKVAKYKVKLFCWHSIEAAPSHSIYITFMEISDKVYYNFPFFYFSKFHTFAFWTAWS